jgi:alpha-glucosidase
MNEPASFCNYPCNDPAAQAIAQGLPPNRTTPAPPPNAPIILSKRTENETGLDLLNPPYSIHVATNGLSDRSSYTNIIHANGLTEYDTRKCHYNASLH